MVKVCTKSLGLLDFPIHFKFDYVIQLELITSGQCIAQNHGKNRLSNFSVGSVSNKQKIFYHFKQIRLNLCQHNTYIACKRYLNKIPDWRFFIHSFTGGLGTRGLVLGPTFILPVHPAVYYSDCGSSHKLSCSTLPLDLNFFCSSYHAHT